MKKTSVRFAAGTTLLVLAVLLSGIAVAAAAPAEKVTVCHATGNGSYRQITVSEKAAPAHFAHGDVLPGTLVGDNYVAEDCSVQETTTVTSGSLAFGPNGWGGISCPAGTTVVGGGFEPATATVTISEAAKPGSASGLYPNYPHYTFPPGETGWVVQNNNDLENITVFAICAAE